MDYQSFSHYSSLQFRGNCVLQNSQFSIILYIHIFFCLLFSLEDITDIPDILTKG